MQNRIGKKEKKFLAKILSRSWTLEALDAWANENNDKEFKRVYGMSIEQAQNSINKLVIKLGGKNE